MYPEYYIVIRSPIDFREISHKIKTEQVCEHDIAFLASECQISGGLRKPCLARATWVNKAFAIFWGKIVVQYGDSTPHTTYMGRLTPVTNKRCLGVTFLL